MKTKQTMKTKTKLALAALLAAVAIGAAERQQHNVIILEGEDNWLASSGPDGTKYYLVGYRVRNYDASPGSPQLDLTKQGYRLAETIANLKAQGYSVTHVDGRVYTLEN